MTRRDAASAAAASIGTGRPAPWRCMVAVCLPLVLLLCGAAAVRAAYLRELALEHRHVVRQLEQGRNLAWARAAAMGDWSRETIGDYPLATLPKHPYVHPPGYPSFLAGLYRIGGVNRFLPLALQQLLGVWVVWLAWFAARRWVSAAAGWVAGLLVAFHWSAVYYGGEFLDAGLLAATATAAVVATLRLGDRVVECDHCERGARAAIGSVPLALAAGLAVGTACIVRPSAASLLPPMVLWLLWTAWRTRNPSLRAAAVAVMSQNLPPSRHVDEASDVLLASMEPSPGARLRATLRGIPAALRLAGPVLLGVAAGVLLAVGPVAWRNARVGGRFVPVCVGGEVAALAAALPEYQGVDDGDVGVGSRLDRAADYEVLAAAVGSDDPRAIARHFRRQRTALLRREPEATARSLARRLELFWGPLDVGSSSVVERERAVSATLRWLPLPFSVLNALSVLGLAFCAVPRRRRDVPSPSPCAPTGVEPPPLVRRAMPGLLFGVLCLWTLAHQRFLAAGLWRQPLLPLVAVMASVAVDDLISCVHARRWREVGVWAATLFCVWLVVGQNIGGYVPNAAKWHLDQALALEARGEADAADAAYQTVLVAAPGIVDPATGARSPSLDVEPADAARMRRTAAFAATKLAKRAIGREDKGLALRYYRLAAELDPSDGDALANVGLLLLGTGHAADAEAALAEALRREPGAWVARYPLAQALYRLGRYAEAREQLDILLRIMPEHRPARNLRALVAPTP